MKPFLILQSRPEDETSDDELRAFLKYGELNEKDTYRVRMEKNGIPQINLDDYSAIILGGGPYNMTDPEESKSEQRKKVEADLFALLDEVVERDFPFFGACLGVGFLTVHQKGHVSTEHGEDAGVITININSEGEKDPLLKGLPKEFRTFVGHKESCSILSKGAVLLASSDKCPVQMFRIKQNIYATQFHPELDSKGFEVRVNVYENYGYFDPSDAEALIKTGHKEDITIPMKILRRFVKRYQRG